MIDINLLERFLNKVEKTFPVPLSQKLDLHIYAQKLVEKATLCTHCQNGEIWSMVAGYTDNLIDNMAYIAIVATASEGRGKGLATKLINDFIMICKDKCIDAVHLYVARCNPTAIKMYRNIGFVDMHIQDNPDKIHLIYYIKK